MSNEHDPSLRPSRGIIDHPTDNRIFAALDRSTEPAHQMSQQCLLTLYPVIPAGLRPDVRVPMYHPDRFLPPTGGYFIFQSPHVRLPPSLGSLRCNNCFGLQPASRCKPCKKSCGLCNGVHPNPDTEPCPFAYNTTTAWARRNYDFMNGVPAGLQVYPSKDQFLVLRANGFIHSSTNYDPTTAPEFVADAFYPYLTPSDYFACSYDHPDSVQHRPRQSGRSRDQRAQQVAFPATHNNRQHGQHPIPSSIPPPGYHGQYPITSVMPLPGYGQYNTPPAMLFFGQPGQYNTPFGMLLPGNFGQYPVQPAMPYVGQYGHHSTQQTPQQLQQQTTPSARYEQQRDNKSKAHVPVYNSPPSRTLAATPSQAAPVAPFSTANTVQVPVGLRSDIGKESDHNDAITTLAYSLNTQHPQHSVSNRVIAHPSEKRKSRAIPMEAVSTPEEFIAKWMTGSDSEDSPGPSDKPSSNKKRQRDGHAHANATKRPRGVQSMASTDTRSRRPQQAQFTSNTGSQDATQADERPAQIQAGYHGPDR